ncbi:hypothetical protein [Novosphingobium sp. CECT 9465]|uniref:hypothetical protein n=1 Tax=Novosphingobium sp. CECT 9465 TaxID=2829794 RepID=UPI001E41ED38|nr:hypothetical protein [Novosphingobium sp. CECT 9465]
MFNPLSLDLRTLLWVGAGFCILLAIVGPSWLERRRRRRPFQRSVWAPRSETLMFAGMFGAFALAFLAMRA